MCSLSNWNGCVSVLDRRGQVLAVGALRASSPRPAPLPCSVMKTYFEVTDSETAGGIGDWARYDSHHSGLHYCRFLLQTGLFFAQTITNTVSVILTFMLTLGF